MVGQFVCTGVYVYVCMWVCVFVYWSVMCMFVCTGMCVCSCVHRSVCVCVCWNVCLCLYVNDYIIAFIMIINTIRTTPMMMTSSQSTFQHRLLNQFTVATTHLITTTVHTVFLYLTILLPRVSISFFLLFVLFFYSHHIFFLPFSLSFDFFLFITVTRFFYQIRVPWLPPILHLSLSLYHLHQQQHPPSPKAKVSFLTDYQIEMKIILDTMHTE